MERNIIRRTRQIALYGILAILVLAGIILMTGRANAMNDRSAEGSITLPSDRTIPVSEGIETKINFGNEKDRDSYHYLKIRAIKTGYIELVNDYTVGYGIALCDENKNVISVGDKKKDDFYSTGSPNKYQTIINYGVLKGKIYHIRLKGNPYYKRTSSTDPYIGTVKWTNTAVKAVKFGTSKKKAVNLKKGKNVKGVFTAGNRKAQWYKIKSKKKHTNIYFSASKANGHFVGEVFFKSKGKWNKWKIYTRRGKKLTKSHGYIKKNISRQTTYYVKVYPDYKTSGAYTLKWK